MVKIPSILAKYDHTYTLDILCVNVHLLDNGRHIDDVITSPRRGSEMGDLSENKAETSLKCLI